MIHDFIGIAIGSSLVTIAVIYACYGKQGQ